MSRLETQKLVAGYTGPPIVQEVSVWAESGQVSVVLGANGAGKSTLAKTVVGLISPSAGRVDLDGKDITGSPPHRLVRMGVGYLPQLLNVFDELTIIENLEMGAYISHGDVRHRIDEVFGSFPDLATSPKRRAGQLSGGQQRMLALARTLMADPKLLVLDEPTSGLSPAYADRVWEQILGMRAQGIGFLVVEQGVRAALSHADHAFVLSNGRLIIDGPAADVGSEEELAALFVG